MANCPQNDAWDSAPITSSADFIEELCTWDDDAVQDYIINAALNLEQQQQQEEHEQRLQDQSWQQQQQQQQQEQQQPEFQRPQSPQPHEEQRSADDLDIDREFANLDFDDILFTDADEEKLMADFANGVYFERALNSDSGNSSGITSRETPADIEALLRSVGVAPGTDQTSSSLYTGNPNTSHSNNMRVHNSFASSSSEPATSSRRQRRHQYSGWTTVDDQSSSGIVMAAGRLQRETQQGESERKLSVKTLTVARIQKKQVEHPPRPRTAFTSVQLTALEAHYAKDPWAKITARRQLAAELQMEEKHVKIWFQNRRAKAKRLETVPEKPPRVRRVKVKKVSTRVRVRWCDLGVPIDWVRPEGDDSRSSSTGTEGGPIEVAKKYASSSGNSGAQANCLPETDPRQMAVALGTNGPRTSTPMLSIGRDVVIRSSN